MTPPSWADEGWRGGLNNHEGRPSLSNIAHHHDGKSDTSPLHGSIVMLCRNFVTCIQDFKGGGRGRQDKIILSLAVTLMLAGLTLASPTYDPILSLIAKYPRYSSYFVSR